MAIMPSYVKIIQLKLKQTIFVDGFLITIFLKTLSDSVHVCPSVHLSVCLMMIRYDTLRPNICKINWKKKRKKKEIW